MEVTFSLDESAQGVLDRLLPLTTGDAIAGRVAAAGADLFQRHLTARNQLPNKNGWPKTNFYGRAAEATFGTADADGATVTVAQEGFRQRYFGGTIVPVNRKMLAFPVSPISYGHGTSEFVLEVKRLKAADAPGGFAGAYLCTIGTPKLPGEPLFRLARKVTQQGDTSIIPSDDEILDTATEAMGDYFDELTEG